MRKLRASLTTLGVVIGITAVVALLSLGQGFQNSITSQLEKGFALNTVIVTTRTVGSVSSGFPLLINYTQEIDNITDVTASVAIIQRLCTINASGGTYIVTVTGIDYSAYSQIYGTTFVSALGSIPLTPNDTTIVVGSRVRDPFQNGTDLVNVGDALQINWVALGTRTYTGTVSAVLKPIGGFGFGGPSDFSIYVPLSQAKTFFQTLSCDMIIVQLNNDNNSTVTSVSDAIKNDPTFGDQVSVTAPTAILGVISSIFSNVEFFLAGIAGISLLVAGIGIMNIMIVSLMERTREIGILKALGMKNRTVLAVFLDEAVIIGFSGSLIGIFFGWTLANIISRLGFLRSAGGGSNLGLGQTNGLASLNIVPVLTPSLFISAFGFGLVVSVIFALYPAWRASKLKPVEALRYE